MKKIYPCLALIALTACSKVNDMHDATMAMNDTTSKMAANTDKMKVQTDAMYNVMSQVYDVGRQGASLDLRNKEWSEILSADKLEDKALHAGLFYVAFEFQLWANTGTDSRGGEKDRLMADAACEFINHLLGITHWSTDEVDPFAGSMSLLTNDSREKAAFNALAITVERNNRVQDTISADTSKDSVSMLSMVKTALLAGKEIREGRAKLESFPSYVDTLLQNDELLTRLLRARYQSLGLAVLTQFTPISNGILTGASYAEFGKSWDLDFSKVSQSSVRLAAFRIQQANEVRDFLRDLGVEVKLDPTIKRMFAHAHVKNFAAMAADKGESGTGEQGALISALKTYTGSK